MSIVRYLPMVSRILLGLAFLAFGLMGFFAPMTPPPETPEAAKAFSAALLATGYMMPMILGNQILVGVLLLSNRFVPLALVLITPFLLNSLAFHVFLERTGLPIVLVIIGLLAHLTWVYRKAYSGVLTAKF